MTHAEYSELIALTQLFLLREHCLQEYIVTDPTTHHFFKNSHLIDVKKEITTAPLPSLPLAQSPVYPLPKQVEPMILPQPIEKKAPLSTEIKEIATPKITKEGKSSIASFSLEPMAATNCLEKEEYIRFFQKNFPHYSLLEKTPSDQKAQKIKNAWHTEQLIPPIILLSFNDQEKHLTFLKNVANAITRHLAPAKVLSGITIEQEKRWESLLKTSELRLIIASDYGLYLLPGLMKHYKENARTAKHFVDQTPLLLLSDLSLYLKEPQLKPLLWRAICTEYEVSCKTVLKK
jgi:hypothetical protein